MFRQFDPVMSLREFLTNLGLSTGTVSWISTLLLVLAVAIIAWLSMIFTRTIVVRVFAAIVKRTRSPYDDKFLATKMFRNFALIMPGVVVWQMASLMLRENPGWLSFVQKSSAFYIVVFVTLTLSSFIEGWHQVWLSHPISRGRSIKPYVQVAKVLIVFTGLLAAVSVLFKMSLVNVVTGLGVATAVLALIFKDTILGLVASVQLSGNKMVRLGDWITIPGRNVDGTVIDMTLYTVKVENFDKTILTVPTYALVSESFQNWRGMEDAGVRRIKREVRIDVRSIAFLTPDLLKKIGSLPLTEAWMEKNRDAVEAVERGEPTSLTNLHAFRAYMVEYLRNHVNIDKRMPIMVRDMPSTDTGLPVEIYCFSKIHSWVPFEGVQSDVIDYTYAVVGRFGLRPFQSPAGSDLEILKPHS
jgi:miniconductance mechanosensitive channel